MHIAVTSTDALTFEINPNLDSVTPEQLTNAVYFHNTNGETHGDIRTHISALDGRTASVENALYSSITANPFQIRFADLSGLAVTGFVWNVTAERLEV